MNNKKIAILVGGEYRHLDIAAMSWQPIIEYGCDFFFSLWDSMQIKSKISRPYDVDRIDITQDMITNYIPNAEIQLLNQLVELPKNAGNQTKQLFHWKKLIDMVDGKDYDILVVLRTDLFFNSGKFNFINSIKLIDDTSLYGTTYIPPVHINEFKNNLFGDCFFMGKYSVVKKFIDSIDITDPDSQATHTYLKDLSQSMKIEVKSLTNSAKVDNDLFAIVRPTVKNIDIKDYNFLNIQTCERYFGITNLAEY